jgi:stage V sporulation protein R
MEGCKDRAREAGLEFQDETLEYIVTNRDLLELSPKVMIPTLYDYWVHDVELLKEKGKYELYPSNPFETVINTRPPISFYNDNNPDWLNVMIFYHVLAHIDFFQNNLYFRHTWEYDFNGQALADKRLIAKLRSEKGRWLDYVIEFARGVDNLVNYHHELSWLHNPPGASGSRRLDYYFDVFVQEYLKITTNQYIKETEKYNEAMRQFGDFGEESFFSEVVGRYPEFETMYGRYMEKGEHRPRDVMEFLLENSEVLKKDENLWMRSVLKVVRNTSIFFQPQIRTKIMNEGWASYWHDKLFLGDDRIRGHEVDYARVNAMVTSLPRVGLNPYALGMRLFEYIEELADKGKLSLEYGRIKNAYDRKTYDARAGAGSETIFKVREDLSDFLFVSRFLDQDFVNRHNLFVSGKRLDRDRMVWEYYVKSRSAEEYRKMILDTLYHPPHVRVDSKKTQSGELYLVHEFEGKPLVTEFVNNTMLGIEYLWGGPVHLETSEVVQKVHPTDTQFPFARPGRPEEEPEGEIEWERVLYTMHDRKLARQLIET